MPYPPFPITKNGKTYLKWKDISTEFGSAIPEWAKKLAAPATPVSKDPTWEVLLWWNGQQRGYYPTAPSKNHALRRAIMDLSSDLGLMLQPTLRKIQADPSLFSVKKQTPAQGSHMTAASNIRLVQTTTPLQAAIKGQESYAWYKYKLGTPLSLKSKAGRHLALEKGSVLGIRKSADGKKFRMVTQATGLTIVFTLDKALADKILDSSTKFRVPSEKLEDFDPETTSEGNTRKLADALPQVLKSVYAKAKQAGITPQTINYLKTVSKTVFQAADNPEFLLSTKSIDKLLQKLSGLTVVNPVKPRPSSNKDLPKRARLIWDNAFKKFGPSEALSWVDKNDVQLDMVSMILDDLIDHIQIALYLWKGSEQEAFDAAQVLDRESGRVLLNLFNSD